MDNTVNHKQRSAVGRRPAGAHCLVTLALILSFIFFSISVASAATKTWITTTGAADWFVGTNWSPSGVPGPTDDVVITNANTYSVLLTGSVAIADFYIGGGGAGTRSLVFSNWNTTLTTTNVTILINGNMTCIGGFSNLPFMSNRVSIACSNNLTIESGGIINVNVKGYNGAPFSQNGSGPGGGANSGFSGGGYGGRGGSTGGGATYGAPEGPAYPGSGGGGSGGYGGTGGNGGGAVQIQAGGLVTVNGSIRADGGYGGGYTGGGSGGGVYIACRTFAGTSGVITVDGGGASSLLNSGGGGGGRVTIIYDPTLQTNQPIPNVRFSAYPGLATYNGVVGGRMGGLGTVYFPEPSFYSGPTGDTYYPFSGVLLAPGLTNLSFDNLRLNNVWVQISTNNFCLTVTNDLQIVGLTNTLTKLELTNAIMTVERNRFAD